MGHLNKLKNPQRKQNNRINLALKCIYVFQDYLVNKNKLVNIKSFYCLFVKIYQKLHDSTNYCTCKVFKIRGRNIYGGGIFEHRFKLQSLNLHDKKSLHMLYFLYSLRYQLIVFVYTVLKHNGCRHIIFSHFYFTLVIIVSLFVRQVNIPTIFCCWVSTSNHE